METLIFYFLILFIGSMLLTAFKPKIKGWMGEKAVSSVIESLPKNKYIVLNNIMLSTSFGTTQIDHVIVSVYGIFVIETKNYKGIITGGEYSEQWTKNMYGKKYNFRNPLMQNYAHVKALAGLTGYEEDMFIPIVTFSAYANLKVNTSKPVIYMRDLKKEILKHQDEKISSDKLQYLADFISVGNIDSKQNRKQHVSQIRNKVSDNENKLANNICPRCGGNLVKRKGKYGEFYGCSNFPKCRYIKKM